MIEPLHRSRRDSTLFQFTAKQLRDFIDPNHLLIRIDEQLDFAKLEAVVAGITTLETEFLANIVLSNGVTVGQLMSPQIEEHYQAGKMPALLPGS